MTTAVDYPTEFGQAYLVEECTCPTGYVGMSCQVRGCRTFHLGARKVNIAFEQLGIWWNHFSLVYTLFKVEQLVIICFLYLSFEDRLAVGGL